MEFLHHLFPAIAGQDLSLFGGVGRPAVGLAAGALPGALQCSRRRLGDNLLQQQKTTLQKTTRVAIRMRK